VSPLLIEHEGKVARLTLNRPESMAVAAKLAAAITR
jgi:enoyl-CoA hydratase/carnithine racemase